MKKTTIEARIKWLDTKEEQEVLFKVGDPGEDDEDIFYYVDSKGDMVDLMEEGNEDFVVIEILKVHSLISREENIYICGRGEIAIAAGSVRTKDDERVCGRIEISRLGSPRPIGSNSMLEDSFHHTSIIFENLESLDIIQKAVDTCREVLAKNNKT